MSYLKNVCGLEKKKLLPNKNQLFQILSNFSQPKPTWFSSKVIIDKFQSDDIIISWQEIDTDHGISYVNL